MKLITILLSVLMALSSIEAIHADFKDKLPITSANLKDQKWLFNEGWFVITSPVKALQFAKENAESSEVAFKEALASVDGKLSPDLAQRLKEAKVTMDEIKSYSKKSSETIGRQGDTIARTTMLYSKEKFQQAWMRVNLGYLQYAKSNHEDLEVLQKINAEFLKDSGDKLNSMESAMVPLKDFLLDRSEVQWRKYFLEGTHAFQTQYEKSGQRGSSLSGLWDVLVGYGKLIYSSVVKPSGKTLEQGARATVYYSTETVLKAMILAHNVVYSLGANIYYVSKLGYKVISPSLEAGYLASLSLASAAASPLSKGLFTSAGIINRVAVSASAPVVGATQFAISQVADKTTDAVTYLVHGSYGTAEVILEKVESGSVLGYSALSQLPPQVLLTAINSAIFLVYEGPKLVIVTVTGKLGGEDIREIPVGAIMDMNALKKEGLEVKTLTDDPETIDKVLKHVQPVP